jgi:hypothetical protein
MLANNRARAKSIHPLVGNTRAGPLRRRAVAPGGRRGGACLASRSWALGARAERCSALQRTVRASAAHDKRARVLDGGPPPFWNTPPAGQPNQPWFVCPGRIFCASRESLANSHAWAKSIGRWLAISALGHSAGGPARRGMDVGEVAVGAEVWRVGRGLWARGPSDARRSEDASRLRGA